MLEKITPRRLTRFQTGHLTRSPVLDPLNVAYLHVWAIWPFLIFTIIMRKYICELINLTSFVSVIIKNKWTYVWFSRLQYTMTVSKMHVCTIVNTDECSNVTGNLLRTFTNRYTNNSSLIYSFLWHSALGILQATFIQLMKWILVYYRRSKGYKIEIMKYSIDRHLWLLTAHEIRYRRL